MRHKCIFVILALVMLLASGCKECKTSLDCHDYVRENYGSYSKSCLDIDCIKNKCSVDVENNCCGNDDCEKAESKCSCPADCGKCSGKAKVQLGSKKVDAEYLEYDCEDNKCMLTLDKSVVRTIDLYDDKTFSYFKWDVMTSIDQPFDIDNSKFKVSIELKDTDEELILPVVITRLKLVDRVERGLIVGQRDTEGTLIEIGDSVTEIIPIKPDSLKDIEDEKKLELVIEYTYKIKERAGSDSEGEPIYEEKIERKTYSHTYDSKIFFVNPGEKS